MVGSVQEQLLRIIIQARNDASGPLRAASNDVGALQASMAMAGRVALTAGVALGGTLAAGLAATVGPAAQFQSTMLGVGAVTGATAAQMASLSALAMKMGRDTVFSSSQAAQGIEELAKGGVSVADIMNGAAQATLNLAAAGKIDLPFAAEVAANAMNQFGLHGRDMTNVANMIAGAANASSIEVMDFRYALASVGAVAHQVGLSFNDTAVAIAELGAAGIKGSDAGTSLRMMLLNLTPSSQQAAEMMRRLHIITGANTNAFYDQHGHVKNLAGIQQVLQNATRGLTEQQQAMALRVIFGTDAIRAAAILAGDGAAGFDKMATSMGKVTAAGVGGARMSGFNGALLSFQGSVENIQITLGLMLLPSLTRFLDLATQVANQVQLWTDTLPRGAVETAVAIAGITAAALTLGGVLTLAALAFGPLTLAIAALIGAGVLLAKAWATDWGGIREATAAAWSAIQPILSGLGDRVQAALAVIRPILAAIATEFQVLGELFKIGGGDLVGPVLKSQLGDLAQYVGTLVPVLEGHLAAWARAFWSWIPGAMQGVLVRLQPIATAVGTWVSGVAAPYLLSHLRTWAAAFWAWVQPATAALMSHLGPLLTSVGNWITSTGLPLLGAKLAEWGGAFWHWIREVGPPMMRELSKLATLLTAAIVAKAPGIVLALNSWFVTTGGPELQAFGVSMGQAIFQGILDGLGQIGPNIGRAGDKIAADWVKATIPTDLKGWVTMPGVGPALGETVGGALGAVGGLFSSAPAGAQSLVPGTGSSSPPATFPALSPLGPLGIMPFRNTASPLNGLLLSGSRQGPGPSTGPVTHNTTVNIHKDAINVSGTGGSDMHDLAKRAAQAAAATMQRIFDAEASTGVGPVGLQPGARAS